MVCLLERLQNLHLSVTEDPIPFTFGHVAFQTRLLVFKHRILNRALPIITLALISGVSLSTELSMASLAVQITDVLQLLQHSGVALEVRPLVLVGALC